mgnify:CR=1 FL=1
MDKLNPAEVEHKGVERKIAYTWCDTMAVLMGGELPDYVSTRAYIVGRGGRKERRKISKHPVLLLFARLSF